MSKEHQQTIANAIRSSRLVRATAVGLVVTLFALTTPSTGDVLPNVANQAGASVENGRTSLRSVVAHDASYARSMRSLEVSTANMIRNSAPTISVQSTELVVNPTPSDPYITSLIEAEFPRPAWRDALAVAWCESRFHTTDIHFDSNGTHDRGLFQLNDGGTEQYLLGRIGQDPNNLDLAFNPVLNVRAAAVLYLRDGWSQWSCASVL